MILVNFWYKQKIILTLGFCAKLTERKYNNLYSAITIQAIPLVDKLGTTSKDYPHLS